MTKGTVYQIGVDGLTGDDSGKIELASIFTSTCTTTAPIAITAPANAAVSASVAVTAASASGTTVDFYLDGELQATDTSPLRLDLDTTRSTNASHTLLAKAYAGSTLLGSSLPRTAQAANTITHDTDEFEPNNSSPMPCPSRLAPPAMAASAARRM